MQARSSVFDATRQATSPRIVPKKEKEVLIVDLEGKERELSKEIEGKERARKEKESRNGRQEARKVMAKRANSTI